MTSRFPLPRPIDKLVWLIAFICLTNGITGYCQTNDSLQVGQTAARVINPVDDTTTITAKLPSPRRALILSAILPGAGQAYNKKYWKIPLIYIGAGIFGYLIQDNYRKYIIFRDAFIAKQRYNVYTLEKYLPQYPEGGALDDLDAMRRNRDQFRRYFELNIILSGVLYALNIVDANVDAHLKGFRLIKDGLTLSPALPSDVTSGGLTLRLTLK